MPKKKKVIKCTLAQQVALIEHGVNLLNRNISPDAFQVFVDEVNLPFPIRGIQHLNTWKAFHGMDASLNDGGIVFEARHSGEFLFQYGEPFLAAFPFKTGCLLVGHPEDVTMDKGTIAFLRILTRILDLYCDSFIVKEESLREVAQLKAEAATQSMWDDLTLLPNSKLFPLLMSPMLAHARRSKDLTAIVYLEIGKLNDISEQEGANSAEKILKLALERMMRNLREGDIVVRDAPERFLWCLGGLHSVENTTTVAEKMLLSLSRPLDMDGKTFSLNGSIGISVFPNDGPDPESLMRNAESALDVSRKTQGNSIRFFTKEMNEKVRSYLVSRKELREAASRQEFVLHYQPVVQFGSNQIQAFESLIRWRKPQGATLYPAQFLPLSQQIGMSDQLDDWMIRTAVHQRAAWEKEGQGIFRISVNLSPHYFWEKGLDRIPVLIQECKMDPGNLEVEISELILQDDPEKSAERLNRYQALGIRLTIDDFGATGVLLTNLRRYPVQSIKLASELIRGLVADSPQSAMIASIVSFAHGSKIQVLAKAVETQVERLTLESLGLDGYQGNLFSPALPKNLIAEFFKAQQMKPLSVSVEKTQPMNASDEVLEIVPPKPVEMKKGPEYSISCFYCHQNYNALDAEWCSCLTSDPTIVCPGCRKCFCRAPLDYRHQVWGAAPETLWDRRRKHEEDFGPIPVNESLDYVKRPLVLVVDDEPLVLKTAYKLIKGLGYSVVLGRDGQQGLQLGHHYIPDLVISDALMPKLDGREMCAALKREASLKNMKTVIMTSFSGAAKYKANVIRESQFDEYLQKPVEFEKLKAALQKLL